jgi:modulator of FtsH protease HflK
MSNTGRPGPRPDPDPWGDGARDGSGRQPGGRGTGGGNGGGPGGPSLPDLDRIIAQAQDFVRRLLGWGSGSGGSGKGNGHRRGLALLGLGAVALWLASGLYRVEPDQEGVVTRFGAFTRLTPPGLNYHLPWPVETVQTPAVTRVNRIEIGYRSGERDGTEGSAGRDTGREVAQEGLMLTGDENIVDVNIAVLWRIANVEAYVFNTRDPRTTVRAVTESVLREVMGRTPIQPALGPLRAQIADQVMHQTQEILDGYHAGVQIVQVLPQRVDPPAAVIESFRDVQRANTDAERLRNEADSYRNDIVPRARGEASRIVALAEGDRQAAIARATGEAKRFQSVLTAYQADKDVTMKRLYLDTMQDVLSHSQSVVLDDKLRNVLPFLPLSPEPGAAQPAPPAAPATPSAPAAGARS